MIRLSLLFALGCSSAELPAPPVESPDLRFDPQNDFGTPSAPILGIDAYRQWGRWADLRFGVRAYMRSTYDRSGGNESADASHFLRAEDDRHVTLDVAGRGLLAFVRTNHWHGSPWHYILDGNDTVVSESSTATPNQPVVDSVFLPEALFPNPLTWTWSKTRGADLNWVPLPFAESLELAYGRTHYGTGYYIYQLVAEDTAAPLPWDAKAPPADVLGLLGHAGEDLAPPGEQEEALLHLAPTARFDSSGPKKIRVLRLTANEADAIALGQAHLRISWDGHAPSVDAPVTLFYGAGTLYNRAQVEYLVKALPAAIRFSGGKVELSLYFPMPFYSSARIDLESAALLDVMLTLRSEPLDEAPFGYFHATYADHSNPEAGHDLVLLDTTRVEGGVDFCGHFVGTSFIFSDRAVLSTLEGDPRFFFDDSLTPQAQGTGTEEWGGGGDYWGGETMTLPLAGHPVGAPSGAAQNAEDAIESAYRFLLADMMPFGKNALITLEHGGTNESTEHYQTVTYWYGRPGGCLHLTDSLHVGDAADEASHGYVSPTASAVETLSSRYEWGVDHIGGVEIFPESTDSGRHMSGTSEFAVAIAKDNRGVLLRRKLDYSYANQRAEVSIADDVAGAPFVYAATWYLAGSNQAIYSAPPGELDPPQNSLQTSNRRWRDDELLLPRRLTEGRERIRIRIRFEPRMTPLYPGGPAPPNAWSEYRYWVYSYE